MSVKRNVSTSKTQLINLHIRRGTPLMKCPFPAQRQRGREREKETERERDRDTHTHTHTHTHKERDRERETQTELERNTHTHTCHTRTTSTKTRNKPPTPSSPNPNNPGLSVFTQALADVDNSDTHRQLSRIVMWFTERPRGQRAPLLIPYLQYNHRTGSL